MRKACPWPAADSRSSPTSTPHSCSKSCACTPGRFTPRQYGSLNRRIKRRRQHARARGVVIEHLNHRRLANRPRGRRQELFKDHWPEMLRCLEAEPDQTALELSVEFQARYPGHYHIRNLSVLQRRVRAWRRGVSQRLVCDMYSLVIRPTTAA